MVATVPLRLVVALVGFSHLLRSAVAPELTTELKVELTQFRAELSQAKAIIQSTSAVLASCDSHSNLLRGVIKVLVVSDIALVTWVIYLIFVNFVRSGSVAPCALDDLCARERQEGTLCSSSPREVDQTEIRRGPVRPSDLKKRNGQSSANHAGRP